LGEATSLINELGRCVHSVLHRKLPVLSPRNIVSHSVVFTKNTDLRDF